MCVLARSSSNETREGVRTLGSSTRLRHATASMIFSVDRDGNTIEEWLHLDDYLAPAEGAGEGAA